VAAYLKLLTTVVNNVQTDQTTIKNIVAAGTAAAKEIPGVSSSVATSALTALQALAGDIITTAADQQIADIASKADKPLSNAVGYLIKYYPQFLAKEQAAFNAWDECANEKLVFIRDQPLGKIPSYRQAYFTTANGLDLTGAYKAYQTQRQAFILQQNIQNIDKTLNQIIAQNKTLADPTLTWDDFQTAAQSLTTLYTDLQNTASAVKQLNTPAKAAAKPAAAAAKSAAAARGMITLSQSSDNS